MKIIGGRDYYDGAGWGIDPDILFIRHARDILDPPVSLRKPIVDHALKIEFHFFVILLAGEILPGIRELHNQGTITDFTRSGRPAGHGKRRRRSETLRFDATQTLEALEHVNAIRGGRSGFILNRNADDIHTHFAQVERKDLVDWMITEHIVTGIVTRDGHDGYGRKRARVNTDGLSDYELYRLRDPATTHMAISSWIGGVLPSGPETVDISDRSRIRKAGFDTRTSFRQAPGIKKPRRRKT